MSVEESEAEYFQGSVAGSDDGSSESAEDRIFAMCLPLVEAQDAELLDVERIGATLRLYVDSEPSGITTAQLTKINRSVSALFDEVEPIAGRYTLEVSSPGLERRLTRPAHFERAIGENVIVKLERHIETRRIKGELLSASPDLIVVSAVEIDGIDLPEPERREIPIDEIHKTRTVFEWGPKGKPGHPNKNKGKK